MTRSADDYSSEQMSREESFVEIDRFTEARYAHFASVLGRDFSGDVLDVGCGKGIGGRAFKAVARDAKLDGSELLPRRIEELPPGVYRNVYAGLLQNLDPEITYDAILAGEVLEHVPFEHVPAFLSAIRDHLHPGGRFLMTTPNPHYFLLKRRSGNSVLGGAHVSVWCRQTTRQFLEAIGFEVLKVTGSGKMTRYFGRRGPALLYGAFMIEARRR
jgi:2-polyprenyl-3-methyl-5-hydroxy-6-metoxy-1,4-benzoquinol methylase